LPRFTPGQTLGEYKLIKVLGAGTFAEVWLGEKATDVITRFALKIPSLVDKYGQPNGVDVRKIKKEASYWAAASHPGHTNVVPVIEAGDFTLIDDSGKLVHSPEGPFFTIVMEYCAEGSLHDWLTKHGGKSLSIEAAVSVVKGIGAGLAHLHSRGLIHRDIKPANIMMLGNTPRIADFGLVRGADETVTLSANGLPVAAGSPAYMSPEALIGERHEDVDVWALGVVLYQLLQGSLPRMITSSGPIPPLDSHVPNSINELLLNVFRDDRKQRIRSVEEFDRRLDYRKQVDLTVPSSINFAAAKKLLRDSDSSLVASAQKVLDELCSILSIQEWSGNRKDAPNVVSDLRRMFQNPVMLSPLDIERMLAEAERTLNQGPPERSDALSADLAHYDWVESLIAPFLDAMPSVEDYEDKLFEFPVTVHASLLFVRIHQEFRNAPRAGSTWGLVRSLSHTQVGDWVLPFLAATLDTKGPGWWEHREVIEIARQLLADRFSEWYRSIRGRSVSEDIAAEEKKDNMKWRRATGPDSPD